MQNGSIFLSPNFSVKKCSRPPLLILFLQPVVSRQMKFLSCLLLILLSASTSLSASEPGARSSLPYRQTTNAVYGETHGTGLLMDIFTPRDKTNGFGIVDVVSGAYSSDRAKIRDHTIAQVYNIFCGRGYTVFAIRPGS